MPRDQRSFMTFPIDMWMHPKVAPLSAEAKWTFVEMNGYSRMQDLDGRIPAVMAHRMWNQKPLRELVNSHPEKPLVVFEDDIYVIRDYSEHQLTTEDRDALIERNRENGRKGGRPRKNPNETGSVSGGKRPASKTEPRQNPDETHSKAESELEIDLEQEQTDVTHLVETALVGDVAASKPGFDDLVLAKAARLGIKDLTTIHQRMQTAAGGTLTVGGTLELVELIMSKATTTVRDTDAYIHRACKKPDEITHWAVMGDLYQAAS